MKTCKKKLHQYEDNIKQCPECYKEYHREYYIKNKNKVDVYAKAHYEKHKEMRKTQIEAYKKTEKYKQQCKRYVEAHQESLKRKDQAWYEANKEHCKEQCRQYAKTHKAECTAKHAKRRAKKLNATPLWLSKEQLEEIKQIYILAANTFDENGNHFHVDHIVPLQGKDVSGLHVPWNLQILPAKENISKSNKLRIPKGDLHVE